MAATGFAAWMRKPMPNVSKIVIIKAILGASLIIFISYNIWCYGFWNYLNESILPFIRDIFVEIISGVASMIVVNKILHD
jgi:hypothetical protein